MRKNLLELSISFFWFLLTWSVFIIFKNNTKLYEVFYRNGVYTVLRNTYDYFIGKWLFFPAFFCSIILALYLVFFFGKKISWTHYFFKTIRNLSFLIFLFYLFWGWNYAQPSLSITLYTNDFNVEVDSIVIEEQVDKVIDALNESRARIQQDTNYIDLAINTDDLEQRVKKDVITTLNEVGVSLDFNPRIRVLSPAGFLMRFGASGMYLPFAFEGQIDAGLTKIEWPYTMAHEMFHAFSITDEGTCNFLAFVSCIRSDDPVLRYSALLDYSIYLFNTYHRNHPSAWKQKAKRLNKGYFADLHHMRQEHNRYPDLFPMMKKLFYDNYLKMNGVEGGLKSYSRIVNEVVKYDIYCDKLF